MANIQAILKINDEGNGILTSYETTEKTNNLSIEPYSTDILNVVNSFDSTNEEYGGAIGTPIGLNRIADLRFGVVDSNGERSEEYKGLDFGFTDSSKNFYLQITITGVDIISFKIVFDKLRGQYPTNYYWVDINGETHTITGNTSNEITFEQSAGTGETNIYFSQWALANTMVGITFIENVEIDAFLNKRQIQNLQSQTQSTSDPRILNYSVLANTGQIVLRDYDVNTTNQKTLLEMAKLGYLNVNIFTLSLFINNKLIQTHITNQTPYYNSDKTLEFQLTNELSKWNDFIIQDTSFVADTTLYNVLINILQLYDDSYTTDVINEMLTETIVIEAHEGSSQRRETTLENYFKSIVLPSFTLKRGTLIDQINKICVIAQIQCYIDDNGTIKFINARPTYNEINYESINPSRVISIPFNKQVTELNYDILVANRFDDVEIK